MDTLGRPTEVILPDGNRTTYTYSVSTDPARKGTLTLITDPVGKRKRYLQDAFGRLVRVQEPDAGGTLIETARYTFDVMGRMTKVEMGRRGDGAYKQTRTFRLQQQGSAYVATNPLAEVLDRALRPER